MPDPSATPAYPVKRISRRRSSSAAPPPEQSSILRDAGAAAMTGLHTVGSLLSLPSRAVWGTANALAGGEGGFGNLNPFDSTGGIELSKFLANQGVISQNDPNKWEWGDLGRGLLDIAGDPLSYVAPLSLTKAGQAASKGVEGAGKLAATIPGQIASKQRALVGLQLPLMTKATGVLGTGEGAANVAAGAGRVLKPIAESAPVRGLRRLFDYRAMGAKTAAGQAAGGDYWHGLRPDKAENARLIQGAALNTAEMATPSTQQTLRQSLERFNPSELTGMEPKGSLSGIHAKLSQNIAERQSLGLPADELLDDVTNLIDPTWDARFSEATLAAKAAAHQEALMGGITGAERKSMINDAVAEAESAFLAENPRHQINYVTRHVSPQIRKALGGGSSSYARALSVQTPEMLRRNPAFQQFAEGTEAINRIVRDSNADAIIQQGVKRGLPPEDIAGEVMQYIQDTYNGQFVDEFVDPMTREVSHRSRVLAEMMVGVPEIRRQGLFTNSPLVDIHGALNSHTESVHAAKAAFKQLAQHSQESFPEEFASAAASVNNPLYHGFIDPTIARPVAESGQHIAIRDALNKLGFDPEHLDVAAQRIAEHTGTPAADTYRKALDWATAHGMDGEEATALASKAVLDRRVAAPLVDDLLRLKPEWKVPQELSTPAKFWKGFTAAFKAGVLTAPARDTRDLVGGQVANAMNGWFHPKSALDAQAIYDGAGVSGYLRNPAIVDFIKQNGLDETDEGAAEALRRIYAMYHPGRVSIASELDAANYAPTGVEDILGAVPGRKTGSVLGNVESVARTAVGQSQTPEGWKFSLGNLDPRGIPGVRDIPQPTLGPVKANQAVTDWVDFHNRMGAFLTRIRNGETDIPKIMDEIDFAQVNYDPATFTPTEDALRQVFPFWKFYARQVPYVASKLASNPAGRLAQTIKGVDRSSSGDPSLPDVALSGTTIPLGQTPAGEKSFLTGFGLMHETPAELLGQAAAGDLQSLGYNILGMGHPLAKGPLEAITGQSFFREGEPLNNLDPTIGRLLSNIGETTGLRQPDQGPVPFPYSEAVDQIVGNSPLSRLATSARTAFDPRRSIAEKAGILGSGLRITRQSPEAQRKTLRNRIDDLAKSEGAKVGAHGPYATDAQLAANPRLQQIIAVRRQLDREAQQARRAKGKTGGRIKRKAAAAR